MKCKSQMLELCTYSSLMSVGIKQSHISHMSKMECVVYHIDTMLQDFWILNFKQFSDSYLSLSFLSGQQY